MVEILETVIKLISVILEKDLITTINSDDFNPLIRLISAECSSSSVKENSS